jgi:hypothetical protein
MSKLNSAELRFCRRCAELGDDPVQAYLDTFGGTIEDEELGQALGALLNREDIRLETYVQQRLLSHGSRTALVYELEEARELAMACGDAELAAGITNCKAILLGHLPAPRIVAIPMLGGASCQDVEFTGSVAPVTVH